MLSSRVVRACTRLVSTVLVGLLVAMALGATAGVPRKISYQGRLTDPSGNPAQGDHTAMFVVYNDATEGVVIWSESKTVTADSNGVFSTILGSVTPIDCSFTEPRWLEVYIDGLALAPRREIVSVASALVAGEAAFAGNADSLGHAPAASYSPVGHVHDDTYPLRPELSNPGTINQPTNPVDWSNLKNVPPGFADGADAEGGAGDGYSLDAADGNPTDAVYVDGAGEVGLGTSTPARNLHIKQDANAAVGIRIENNNTGSGSAESIEFTDETGTNAGIFLYDDGATQANDLQIFNERSSGAILLSTNTAADLVVGSDGRVGVGTGVPEASLHVIAGSAGEVTASTLADVVIEDNETAALSFLSPSAYTQGLYFGDAADNVDGWVLYDHSDDKMRLGANNDTKMTILSNGRVGVGTTAPESDLHVVRNFNGYTGIKIENADALGGASEGIWFADENGTNAGITAYGDAVAGGANCMQISNNRANGAIFLATAGFDRVWVAHDGNVGIGANAPSDPTAALDVDGTNGYNQVRMRTSFAPTNSADSRGNVGDIAWSSNYIYVKTAGGWKRAALSSW
ncbi:MAG: hypothetical protein WAW06_12185 [bacterium]